MSNGEWEPFRDLMSLQDKMNRLFEESAGREDRRKDVLQGRWVPPVDVYETADAVVMQAELPGVSREDIVIEVRDNTLYLRGERRFQKDVKQESYHRIERVYGSFNRSFALPAGVRLDDTKARLADGVLEILIPKQAKAKPRQIEVTID